ncbi:MAG TPA: phosphate/phosphite/phosphonate ABC transporter substrate-binding protein, partial [bacterium]|nr:phosphate/phosphite/phosphonate ABC transporter substrate-binding protein [bacterium]
MAPIIRTPLLRLLFCSLLAAATLLPPAARAGESSRPESTIRLCVVVSSSPDYVILQWYPMLTYLTGAIGRPFEILIRDSYEDMLDDYRRGEIDLLMSGPFNYVKTKQAAGATLVAAAERLDPKRFHGVIAVRGASPVDSLEELRGKTFAFTEPYSTTGYLLPRLIMADAGIVQPADFFREVVFSGHHAEALEAVISGHVDAAAFVSYLVDETKRDRGIDLKVIATTPT